MARLRTDLHTLLKAVAQTDNVYFQPPENLVMDYPCVRYERDQERTEFADDRPYNHRMRYLVTVIDKNPDGAMRERIRELPMCVHNRFYAANQLNHDVFTLFF